MKHRVAASLLDSGRMSFSRVYVPPGRLSDVIRDETRYIPMDAKEFDAVVQRLLPRDARRAFEAPRPVAEYVLYELKLDDSGTLRGNVSIRLQGLGGEVEICPGEARFQNILWFDEEGIAPKQIDWLQESVKSQPRDRSFKSDGMPVDLFGKPGGSIDFQSPGAGRFLQIFKSYQYVQIAHSTEVFLSVPANQPFCFRGFPLWQR